jgi:hypothetical protein
MKLTSLRKKLLFNGALLSILAGALAPMLNATADPISDLRSLSALKDVDLSNPGKISQQRVHLLAGWHAGCQFKVPTLYELRLRPLSAFFNDGIPPGIRSYGLISKEIFHRDRAPRVFVASHLLPPTPPFAHLLKRPSSSRATLRNYS